ncbi:hypothetical protein TTRE_0000428201 [Trichuris trichiura]|uniref:Uncharacterized protein n=1 Tax=Trichuris trichiura TaxID=36087 RepID=A0A077Z8N1_TRITR|nr:hypothetical protein TTRE_0000428201 [Trichuris trichiura]
MSTFSSIASIRSWIEEVIEASGGDLNEAIARAEDTVELELIREQSMHLISEIAIEYKNGLLYTSYDRESLLEAIEYISLVSDPKEMILSLMEVLSTLNFKKQEAAACLPTLQYFVFLLRLVFDCIRRGVPGQKKWFADVQLTHLFGLTSFINLAIDEYGLEGLLSLFEAMDELNIMLQVVVGFNKFAIAIDDEKWFAWTMKVFEILFPLFLASTKDQSSSMSASSPFDDAFRAFMAQIMENAGLDLPTLAHWHRRCKAALPEKTSKSTIDEIVCIPQVYSVGFFLAAYSMEFDLPLRVYKIEYVFCDLLPCLVELVKVTLPAQNRFIVRRLFVWFFDRMPMETFSKRHLGQLVFQKFVYRWLAFDLANVTEKKEACNRVIVFLNFFEPDARVSLFHLIFSSKVEKFALCSFIEEPTTLRSVFITVAQCGLRPNGDITPTCGGSVANRLLQLFTILPERLLEGIISGSHFAQLSETLLFMQKILLICVKDSSLRQNVLGDFRAAEKRFLKPLKEELSKCNEVRLTEKDLDGGSSVNRLAPTSGKPSFACLLNILLVMLMEQWRELCDP